MVCQAWHSGYDAIRQRDQLYCRISTRTLEGMTSRQGHFHPCSSKRKVTRATTKSNTPHPHHASSLNITQDARLGRAHDGVLGAYNSTRYATTGFLHYVLQHRAEKLIHLLFIYPEFAARGVASKEEFVHHLSVRQQAILELVGRNKHQAQLRQTQKFDKHLKAKAHAVGEVV